MSWVWLDNILSIGVLYLDFCFNYRLAVSFLNIPVLLFCYVWNFRSGITDAATAVFSDCLACCPSVIVRVYSLCHLASLPFCYYFLISVAHCVLSFFMCSAQLYEWYNSSARLSVWPGANCFKFFTGLIANDKRLWPNSHNIGTSSSDIELCVLHPYAICQYLD